MRIMAAALTNIAALLLSNPVSAQPPAIRADGPMPPVQMVPTHRIKAECAARTPVVVTEEMKLKNELRDRPALYAFVFERALVRERRTCKPD